MAVAYDTTSDLPCRYCRRLRHAKEIYSRVFKSKTIPVSAPIWLKTDSTADVIIVPPPPETGACVHPAT